MLCFALSSLSHPLLLNPDLVPLERPLLKSMNILCDALYSVASSFLPFFLLSLFSLSFISFCPLFLTSWFLIYMAALSLQLCSALFPIHLFLHSWIVAFCGPKNMALLSATPFVVSLHFRFIRSSVFFFLFVFYFEMLSSVSFLSPIYLFLSTNRFLILS